MVPTRKYALLLVGGGCACSLVTGHYVPFTKSFSVVALPVLYLWNALDWISLPRHLSWRILAAISSFFLFAPILFFTAGRFRASTTEMSALLLLVTFAHSFAFWRLTPDASLRRLFAVKQSAVWFICQMTLYFEAAQFVFPTSGLTWRAMAPRLFFWLPIFMTAVWAVGVMTGWRRFYKVLILIGFGQLGNGFMDLWGMKDGEWPQYVAILLWIVFVVGLVYCGIDWALTRMRGPSPPSAGSPVRTV